MSALSNTKTTEEFAAVPERPAGLPAIYGDAPMNFVATEWGNWGTVLRIAVTSESPHKELRKRQPVRDREHQQRFGRRLAEASGIQERGQGEPVRGSSDAGRADR